MGYLVLTKEARFSAAHRLYSKDLTPEQNESIFGKCTSDHGHNYRVQVSVAAKENYMFSHLGMLMNAHQLKQALESVIDELDHKHLNDLAFFQANLPYNPQIYNHFFTLPFAHMFFLLLRCVVRWRMLRCTWFRDCK